VSVDEGLFIEQSDVSGLISVYKKGLVSVDEGLFIEQSDVSGLISVYKKGLGYIRLLCKQSFINRYKSFFINRY
jgi:hypothetical protein